MVVESSPEHKYQALDIQLWVNPEGALQIFWCQNNVLTIKDEYGPKAYVSGEYVFNVDNEHATWCVRSKTRITNSL